MNQNLHVDYLGLLRSYHMSWNLLESGPSAFKLSVQGIFVKKNAQDKRGSRFWKNGTTCSFCSLRAY